jgi:hypothetical protein
MNNVDTHSVHTFEQLKQVDQQGNEFWYARAIAKILDYSDFRNFVKVINKAIAACEASGNKASDHIVEVNEMVKIGSNTERSLNSFSLSRYACYLIVQNGDPAKPVIAAGNLSERLRQRFGKGFDVTNLRNMRRFYQLFPIRDAVRLELSWTYYRILMRIENPKAREWYA